MVSWWKEFTPQLNARPQKNFPTSPPLPHVHSPNLCGAHFCMVRVSPISIIQMNQQLQCSLILHGHGENDQRRRLPDGRPSAVHMSTFPRHSSPRHLLRRKPFGFLLPSFITRCHYSHLLHPFLPFPPQTSQTTPHRLQNPRKFLSLSLLHYSDSLIYTDTDIVISSSEMSVASSVS